MPVTYAEAEEAGTLDDYEWGDRCDTETGKLKVQSVYASPCVPVFDGDDNGGATAPGVTADTVRIVRYVPEENADIQAILTGVGANDTPEESSQTYQQFLQLSSALSETYGRTVELVDFQGTGAGDDIVAAKADATQIVEELEPFAVLGGPGLDRGTFGQEITSNGIVCIDCAGAIPADMADGMRPYIWSGLPPTEQFLQTLNTWLANLAETPDGTKAIYAGDARVAGTGAQARRDPLRPEPAAARGAGRGLGRGRRRPGDLRARLRGAAAARDRADGEVQERGDHHDHLPRRPDHARLPDGRGDDAGVLPRVDHHRDRAHRHERPRPRLEPRADDAGVRHLATRGAGRARAAGRDASSISGTSARARSRPRRTQYAIPAAAMGFILRGIHMAGPELTAETFARGQFRVPPAGGGPTTPQVSYGNWGFFEDTDYAGIDDSAEIWWDPTVEVEDETGTVGAGAWRRAHGGERFVDEEDVPVPNPFADPDDTVTVLTTRPAEDTAPVYPPPPGSPAAGG